MRSQVLAGETTKVKINLMSGTSVTFYITVNYNEDSEPFEVFVNVKDSEYWEHLVATTVLISRLLQAGVSVHTIAADLRQIESPKTGHMMDGGKGWCPSIYARIGMVLMGG